MSASGTKPTAAGAGDGSKKDQSKDRGDGSLATARSALPQLPAPKPNEAASDAFARAVMKKSLAGLCVSAGFGSAEGGALHALCQVAQGRVAQIASEMKVLAEHSGRKQVVLEDLAEVVKRPTEAFSTSQEPLRYLVGIPRFPVDSTLTPAQVTLREGTEVEFVPGLAHFPPLPPVHTYKRTRIEARDIPESSVPDLKRTQQRNSALVRESLAKMRPRSEVAGAVATVLPGEQNNLARLVEGDFES